MGFHQETISRDDRATAIWTNNRLIVWALTFLGSWIYCVVHYGFLFGVGLGWLPSFITAYVVAFMWPLILVMAVLMFLIA